MVYFKVNLIQKSLFINVKLYNLPEAETRHKIRRVNFIVVTITGFYNRGEKKSKFQKMSSCKKLINKSGTICLFFLYLQLK